MPIQYTLIFDSMNGDDLNQHLLQLINVLLTIITAVYKSYSPAFHLIALATLAYLSFKIGTITIVDPLQSKVNHIRTILRDRRLYSIYLPIKIAFLSKLRTVLLISSDAGLILIIILKSLRYRPFRYIQISWLFFIATLVLSSILLIWLYECLLTLKLKAGKFNDLRINEKTFAIVKSFGTKAEGLLKLFLSPQKFTNRNHSTLATCTRKKCQQLRNLLKQQEQRIEYLTQSVLNFQWCTKCRKMLPFDEFLPFQTYQFPASSTHDAESQVIIKNKHLVAQLQRMTEWIREVAPCNCSKLYWKESITYIKNYKQKQKEIDQKIAKLENQSTYRK